MIPYDTEVLRSVLAQYGASVWPAQIVAFALGALAVGLILFRSAGAGRIVAAILAAAWLWIGGVYELLFYAQLNWAGTFHAAIFVLQMLLLLWIGVVRGRLRPRFDRSACAWTGLVFMAGALVALPLLDGLTGRGLYALQVLGITPDATAIFTLGVLLTAASPAPVALSAIPLAWSLYSGWWAWLLDAPDWFVVPGAGVLAAGILVASGSGKSRRRV